MDPPKTSATTRALSLVGDAIVVALLLGAVALARHNLKSGRADQRGARRVTSFLIGAWIAAWLLGSRHYLDPETELNRFFMFAAFAMLNTGFTWLFYLGLEPYVRRFCPDVLISWTRLLSGHVRDPRVGRDVLIGIAAGVFFAVVAMVDSLIPGLVTRVGQPQTSTVSYFVGARFAIATLVRLIPNALQTTMLATFAYVVTVALVRRRWIATVILLLLLVGVILSESDSMSPWVGLLLAAVLGLPAIFILLRYGLLSIAVAILTKYALQSVPLTTDMTRPHAAMAALTIVMVGATAVYAFYVSRAGEGLFRRLLPA
jgi:hypothetical protein